MCMRSGFIWMKCMCVFDSRPGQEFWAHRVQGTHRSTLAKAGPASRKGAGDEAPPGDKAREHVIRATTIDAHGLTCKHGGAPVAGGGALLCWGSRMTRKRQACAKEKPTCVIPNVRAVGANAPSTDARKGMAKSRTVSTASAPYAYRRR